MKVILVAIGLIFCFATSFAQPPVPRASNAITAVDQHAQFAQSIAIPAPYDTTAINGLDSVGLIIYSRRYTGMYIRDTFPGGKKWTRVLKSGDAGTGVVTFNTRSGTVTLLSADVTTALGYTPPNPNGTNLQYIAGDGSKVTFPTIPAQFNPIAGYGILISGSYPNKTFIADTTTLFPALRATIPGGGGSGIGSLNGLTASTQTFSIGTAGTNLNIQSAGSNHAFNIPITSGSNTGLVTPTLFNTWNAKISNITGLVTPGTNVTMTGSGTSGSPYVINSSGGSGVDTAVNSGLFLSKSVVGTTITLNSDTSGTGFSGYFLRRKDSTLYATQTQLATKQNALSGTGYSKWAGTTPSYLTPTQVTADLNLFSTSLQGLVPASGGGTTNFMRADGTWAAPPGGGSAITSLTTDVVATGPGAAAATIQPNAVTTAKINNNAVTLAKEAPGTANSLRGYDGSGNAAVVTLTTTGTSGPSTISGSVLNIPQYTGGGASTPTTTFLGNIYNKKTAWSTLGDFTQSGSTFTTSGSNIVVTNGSAGFVGNEIAINYGSCLEKWTESVRFIVTSSSGSSGGLALGMLATGTTTINAFGRLYLSGANSGKVELDLQNNTQYGISSSALTYSNGDTLLLSVNRDRELISVYAQNITTKSARVTANYIYTVAGSPSMPNTGNFCVYNMGGTQTLTIDSINVNSTALKNSTVYVLGNSKAQYSVVTQFQNSFVSRLGQNFSVINGGGIGDQTAQFLTRLVEIENLAPQYVILADLMSNDQRAAISSATYQANYQAIHDTLRAHGIRIIHASPFYETSINMAAQQTYVNSTYSTDTIANVYDALRLTSGVLNGDGIHPNDLGDSIAYTTLIVPFKIAGAGRTPQTFGEGVANQVALWTNPRQVTSNAGLTYSGNILSVTGYANAGKFAYYTGAPVQIGPYPSGQPSIGFYQAAAGAANTKISRWFYDNGTLEFDYLKNDSSGSTTGMSITGSGTAISNVTLNGQTFINRTTTDGTADLTGLQVQNGISTSTSGAKDIYIGVIGNYDHYVGYGRLGSGNPYWYEQNLNAGTNQKLWDGNYDATGVFTFRALSDGAGGAQDIYNVDRSAYPAIKFNFESPVVLTTGAAGVGKAPLKFLSGTPTTTPEIGAMQFNSGLWIIDSSNSKRDTIATRSWVRANGGSGGAGGLDTLHGVNRGVGLWAGNTNGLDTLFLNSLLADNGLTGSKNSDSTNHIKLGGDLTGNTNITGASTTYALSLGTSGNKLLQLAVAANSVFFNGRIQYNSLGGTDANISIPSTYSFAILPAITANRTVTISASGSGEYMYIINQNTSGNTWTFAGTTVKDAAGNTITTLLNGTAYQLIYDGANFIVAAKN